MKSTTRIAMLAALSLGCAGHAEGAGVQLAVELAREGEHRPAAIEFRRMALQEPQEKASGGYYWLAGREYFESHEPERSNEMLDRAETLNPDLVAPGSLLRADNALRQRDDGAASFYFETLLNSDGQISQYAARRLAGIRIKAGETLVASGILKDYDPKNTDGVASIERYTHGKDKSPALGGILGIVPGMGHAYSGEYANAFRCLILNAIFIYGMADTAEDDEWGAFAVITFFELTWYSGSIYGGIDAAHRHNRERLNDCIDDVLGDATFNPDWDAVPTIRLEFKF